VFVNRLLRRIFGPTWDEVTGGWRKMHNEELRDLYSSPKYNLNIQVEDDEIGGACSANEEGE
jgi:hypothetical protein